MNCADIDRALALQNILPPGALPVEAGEHVREDRSALAAARRIVRTVMAAAGRGRRSPQRYERGAREERKAGAETPAIGRCHHKRLPEVELRSWCCLLSSSDYREQ